MKTYYGNYLGIVINNNDPEFRGRVQVFVPHIMPTLYENWNKKGEDITIKCVGDNIPQGLTSDMVEKLKKILPWSEAASPIIGQSAPGSVSSALAGVLGAGTESTSVAPAATTPTTATESGATPPAAQPGQHLDQSPTAVPAGSLPPGTSCLIPRTNKGVDMKNLKTLFVQRLNGFYEEARKLGYKIECTSGFRSYEKQAQLHKENPRGASPPGGSSHEVGIAVDLYVEGPGVSITKLSVRASETGVNYDTPAFRQLLAKYSLHQPLHPLTNTTTPEHWHIEPVENPAAFKGRGKESAARVAALMSQPANNAVAETTSSSQLPAHASPLTAKNPENTSLLSAPSPSKSS